MNRSLHEPHLERLLAAMGAAVFSSCALFSPTVTGEVVRPEGSLRSLTQKAEAYEEDLRDHHLTPEGLVLATVRVESKAPTNPYADKADQAAWTGCLLAAYAFRHAAEPGQGLDDVRRTLAALHRLQEVTGVPGLLARGIAPGPPPDSRYAASAKGFETQCWRSDPSRDQYALVLFGYAATLACVEDTAIRAIVARDAGAMADHVFSNDREIRDARGRRTTYGDLSPRWGGLLPNGVNAGVLLLAAKVAARASGEERHRRRYEALVREGLPRIVPLGVFRILGLHNPNNDNMTLLCLDGLRRLEEDPEIRALYERGIGEAWTRVAGEGNALFAAIAHGAAPSAAAREEAIEALHLFPDSKVTYAVDNRDLPGLGRRLLPDSSGAPRSLRPVPLHRRPMGPFLWKTDPYLLVARPDARGETEHAGVDYLLAYRMARAQRIVASGD